MDQCTTSIYTTFILVKTRSLRVSACELLRLSENLADAHHSEKRRSTVKQLNLYVNQYGPIIFIGGEGHPGTPTPGMAEDMPTPRR